MGMEADMIVALRWAYGYSENEKQMRLLYIGIMYSMDIMC